MTTESSYENYEGEQINKMNKYGFREGTWIQFYENGKQTTARKISGKELSNYFHK